jgi:hypothetical protein
MKHPRRRRKEQEEVDHDSQKRFSSHIQTEDRPHTDTSMPSVTHDCPHLQKMDSTHKSGACNDWVLVYNRLLQVSLNLPKKAPIYDSAQNPDRIGSIEVCLAVHVLHQRTRHNDNLQTRKGQKMHSCKQSEDKRFETTFTEPYLSYASSTDEGSMATFLVSFLHSQKHPLASNGSHPLPIIRRSDRRKDLTSSADGVISLIIKYTIRRSAMSLL